MRQNQQGLYDEMDIGKPEDGIKAWFDRGIVSQEGPHAPLEEPYYPNWIEKVRHWAGFHCWIDRTARFNIAYRKIEICLICHKIK